MDYNFISIEGCIGTGKTSFAKKLAYDLEIPTVLENFEDNPYLKNFYNDPDKNAFSLELYFMAERYNQQKEIIKNINLFNKTIISDYAFIKSQIFANITLKNPDDLHLFKMLFNIINQNIKQADIILYLHKNTNSLLENINKRGREYEKSINAKYLEKLHKAYMQYFKQQTKSKILIVDSSNLDFIKNPKDYIYLKELLDKKYTNTITFI